MSDALVQPTLTGLVADLQARVARLERLLASGQGLGGTVTSAGAIFAGTGFSVNKTGTGTYTITFNQPFDLIPASSITVVSSGAALAAAIAANPAVDTLVVRIFATATNTATDNAFSFVTVPQPLA